MVKSEIVEYIVQSFEPIRLSITDSVVQKNLEEAIRWFNREGADIVFQQFAFPASAILDLDDYDVDQVLHVYPNSVISEIFTAQSLLLGVTVLDYDIETIALKMANIQSIRTFLASRFRWRWVKPHLYVGGMTSNVTSVVVQYLREYDWESETQSIGGGPFDWIYRYALARVKQSEGRVLRLGAIIEAPLDGDTLVSEGTAELTAIREELRNVRSVLPIMRSP